MKMVDVLNKMANDEIKRGTVLSVYDNNNEIIGEYRYVGSSKAGIYFSGLKTKFTQEEINGSTLLKFVEEYGVKEEVE